MFDWDPQWSPVMRPAAEPFVWWIGVGKQLLRRRHCTVCGRDIFVPGHASQFTCGECVCTFELGRRFR